MGRHHTLAEIRAALEKYHGGVYLAADALGCWPQALYARIAKNPELQHLQDLYDGRRTDAAELKLEQAIRNGDPWAIQFQLKTKGRNRGYVERQEVETNGKLKLEIQPKLGAELDQAIKRTMANLAAGGEESLIGEADTLPKDFRAPASVDGGLPHDRRPGV